MKMIVEIPASVPITKVASAMRELGLSLRYENGELVAAAPSPHTGEGSSNRVLQHHRRIRSTQQPPEAA